MQGQMLVFCPVKFAKMCIIGWGTPHKGYMQPCIVDISTNCVTVIFRVLMKTDSQWIIGISMIHCIGHTTLAHFRVTSRTQIILNFSHCNHVISNFLELLILPVQITQSYRYTILIIMSSKIQQSCAAEGCHADSRFPWIIWLYDKCEFLTKKRDPKSNWAWLSLLCQKDYDPSAINTLKCICIFMCKIHIKDSAY